MLQSPRQASKPQLAILWTPLWWIVSLCVLLFWTRPATAQIYVPSNSPSSGPVNTYPLGLGGTYLDLRTQILVPASYLAATGSQITDVAFATAGAGSYTFTSIEVQLGTLPPGVTFGTTFAQNIQGARTVLNQTNHQLVTIAGAWVDLGLTTPYLHNGVDDLVLDIKVTGSHYVGPNPGTRRTASAGSVEMVNRPNFAGKTTGYWYSVGPKLRLTTTVPPKPVVPKGIGCSGNGFSTPGISWQGTPALNTTFTVELKQAPASVSASLFCGIEKKPGIDLTPLGANGCTLYLTSIANVSVTTDAQGTAAVPFPVPNEQSLTGVEISFQWVVPALGANNLHLVLSSYLLTTVF